VSQNASWIRMSVKLRRTKSAIKTRAAKLGLTIPPHHPIRMVESASRAEQTAMSRNRTDMVISCSSPSAEPKARPCPPF
jgi:hypothetical protein